MTPRLAVLAMMAAVLIYGSNFSISRRAIQAGLTPHDLAALRFGTAGLILLPFFVGRGLRDCAGIGWRRGLLLLLTSGAPLALLMNSGIALSPASHSASITPATVTTVGIVGGMLMLGIRPRPEVFVGLACVLCGLLCFAVAGSHAGSRAVLVGDLMLFTSGLIWGCYPFLLQRWSVPPMVSTAIVSVLSLVFLPVYVLALDPQVLRVPGGVLAFHLVCQGLLNGILGLWLWALAVQTLGAPTAQRFPPLIPAIGTLAAIPVLGEVPGPFQALGVAFIVGGLAFTVLGGRLIARLRPATRS